MDIFILGLHHAMLRAAAEYALVHPENAGAANALSYLVTCVIYAWFAVTLWLGLRAEYWYFSGISPLRAHLEALNREVEAATIMGNVAAKNAPEQHSDGNWYANTYDPSTGEVVGKKKVDPPARTQPISVVTGGQRMMLRR